jgi:hypothetical protein
LNQEAQNKLQDIPKSLQHLDYLRNEEVADITVVGFLALEGAIFDHCMACH